MKMHTIWSNEYNVIEELEKEIIANPEEYHGINPENSWATACQLNDEYLDDERSNLNIECGNDIVVFAVLGLWDGYHNASKDLHRGNIADVFGNVHSCDYVTWYVDELGDLRCKGIHHDGTNNYMYRVWKDGVSEEQKQSFRRKWGEKRATRKDLNRYTRRIGDKVADVYGWDVRKSSK